MDYQFISPGKIWVDTKGKPIQAHGGSMFYENGFYYWYGEDKTFTRKKGKLWTWGINCYRSTDLYNWEDCGHIIEPVLDDKNSIFYPTRRMDRPHIIKNEKTGKYVLWLKYCDKMHFAVLTADAFMGPYVLETAYLRPYEKKAGDFDLTIDSSTGKAYIYFEADHNSVLVAQLNDEYTDVIGDYHAIYSKQKPPLTREGIRPLAMGLLLPEEAYRVAADLNQMIIHNNYHLNTGFLSTAYLCQVLTDYGYSETAYRLLLQSDSPSWLYAVEHGANTIWESWEGNLAVAGNASLNHYSKGAVVGWLFKGICGIHINGQSITIKPAPHKLLAYASAEFDSPFGLIKSAWQYHSDKITYEVTIPANVDATIQLPDGSIHTALHGTHCYSSPLTSVHKAN